MPPSLRKLSFSAGTLLLERCPHRAVEKVFGPLSWAKLETLARFADQPIMLAVADSLGGEGITWPPGTIPFKSALRIGDVLERLREVPSVKCGTP